MLENLLQHFGYPALALGTFLEGEMSLLLAAYLALRGILQIELVMLFAFLGTYASDQLWFHLGRRHGRVSSSAGQSGRRSATRPWYTCAATPICGYWAFVSSTACAR